MIHALPGLGADSRMYPLPWASLPNFVAHDWSSAHDSRSIPDLAERMIRDVGIQDKDVVIGSSIGGMVACEIAQMRDLRAIILIGSATRKEEIHPLLSLLHPLVGSAPVEWLQFSAGRIPSELTQMFSTAQPEFLRTMAAAIFEWRGLDSAPTNLFRIHGSRDRVIPPPDHTDLLLDGGHLIAMTHASECCTFVKKILSGDPST